VNDKARNAEEGFGGIIGQEIPKRILTYLIGAGHLPGTMLFTGPGGVGKLATAIALAKYLHCPDKAIDGCDCPSCSAIRSGTHPDVVVLSQERQIRVEEIRELTALATLRSSEAHERVIIIDRAENISRSAANAALKSLEEPGKHIRFILVTDTPFKLLPTVRSRAYNLRFSLLSQECMGDFARAIGDDPLEKDAAEAIRLSGGRPGIYLRWKHCEGYRETVGSVRSFLDDVLSDVEPSVRKALEWKAQFWELAETLSSVEKKADLPRGGDAYDIARHLASPKEYPVKPVNWRIEEIAKKESRWSQGRKLLYLVGLLRRVLSIKLNAQTSRAIRRLQDFDEKIRFNCNSDIALERLYFGLSGLQG